MNFKEELEKFYNIKILQHKKLIKIFNSSTKIRYGSQGIKNPVIGDLSYASFEFLLSKNKFIFSVDNFFYFEDFIVINPKLKMSNSAKTPYLLKFYKNFDSLELKRNNGFFNKSIQYVSSSFESHTIIDIKQKELVEELDEKIRKHLDYFTVKKIELEQEKLSEIADLNSKTKEIKDSKNITVEEGYDMGILSVGPNKLQVLKLVKDITNLDLKAAKNIIDNIDTDMTLAKNLSKDEAIRWSLELENAGAKIIYGNELDFPQAKEIYQLSYGPSSSKSNNQSDIPSTEALIKSITQPKSKKYSGYSTADLSPMADEIESFFLAQKFGWLTEAKPTVIVNKSKNNFIIRCYTAKTLVRTWGNSKETAINVICENRKGVIQFNCGFTGNKGVLSGQGVAGILLTGGVSLVGNAASSVKDGKLVNATIQFIDDMMRNQFTNNSVSPTIIKQEVDIADQIRKISDLKKDGILTQDEFDKKKAELLSKM
tara:strand:- start:108 stop:1559 length:1452 start_codon:yes stop_codon:yes gene_type:complete